MKYDEEAYIRLSAGLKIDREALDEELIAHAQHFWHVGEAHENAVSAADKKKLDLDLLEAELNKDIREQLTADNEKVTDKIVEAAITRDQDYQRAALDHLNAKRDAGKWYALREAYRHRRDVLLTLSRRSAERYYDDVTGAGDTREARGRFEQRSERGVRSRL